MAGGLPPSACLSILCICLVGQAFSGSAEGPPVPRSWLGDWTGSCVMKMVLQNGFPKCTQADVWNNFRISLTWNATTGKLQYLQNVTGVTGSSSTVQFVPAVADRANLTVVNKDIKFDYNASKPVCVSVDGTSLQFAMVVVQDDGSGRPQYQEEATYITFDPVTFGSGMSCPSNWSWLQATLFCNTTAYNYVCKASPVAMLSSPQSPSSSPNSNSSLTADPSPNPSPSPIPSPFPSTPLPIHLNTSPLHPPSSTPSALLPSSPMPTTHVSSPPPPPPPTTIVNTTQETSSASPSNASIASKRTAILAGSICGAAGVILLLAVIAGYCMHRQGMPWRLSSLLSSSPMNHSGSKESAMLKTTVSEQLHLLTIKGLMPGDPFLRTTAPQYKWIKSCPVSSISVLAGITDKQFDSMSVDGISPAVQLSSTEVQQQLELFTHGLLGRGGAALVFRCRWNERFGDGLLAIKVLKDAFNTSMSVLQSFSYEAQLLSSIRHPNVVQLYGWCLEPPHVCLIMELLPGSLENMLYPPVSTSQSIAPQQMPLTTPELKAPVRTDAAPATPVSSTTGSSSNTQYPTAAFIDARLQTDDAHRSSEPHLQLQQPPPLAGRKWTMCQVLKVSIDVAAALAYL